MPEQEKLERLDTPESQQVSPDSADTTSSSASSEQPSDDLDAWLAELLGSDSTSEAENAGESEPSEPVQQADIPVPAPAPAQRYAESAAGEDEIQKLLKDLSDKQKAASVIRGLLDYAEREGIDWTDAEPAPVEDLLSPTAQLKRELHTIKQQQEQLMQMLMSYQYQQAVQQAQMMLRTWAREEQVELTPKDLQNILQTAVQTIPAGADAQTVVDRLRLAYDAHTKRIVANRAYRPQRNIEVKGEDVADVDLLTRMLRDLENFSKM